MAACLLLGRIRGITAYSIRTSLSFFPPNHVLTISSNALCAPIASNGSDSLILTYPGTDNLSVTEKGDFNDRLLSYNCFKEEDFSLSPPELGTPPNVVGGNMK